MYESPSEIGIDSPVALLVGIGQGISGYAVLHAHVGEFAGWHPETGFDIAQTFAIGSLSECHAAILLGTTERFDLVINPMTINASSHGVPGDEIH